MPKIRVAIAATSVALLGVFASATSASAYEAPVVVVDGGNAADGTVAPGQPITVSFNSGDTTCDWTAALTGPGGYSETAPAAQNTNDYTATFPATDVEGEYTGAATCTPVGGGATPQALGTSEGAVVNASFTSSSLRAQATPITIPFSVTVTDAATGDDGDGSGDDGAAGGGAAGGSAGSTGGTTAGALPDTGGSNWEIVALGAGLLVAGAGVTVAARRQKRTIA